MPVTSLSFPANFPVDDSHLERALDEFNLRREAAGLPRRSAFVELTREERTDVIERAQQLKKQSVK